MNFRVVGDSGFSSGAIGAVASYAGTGGCLTGSGGCGGREVVLFLVVASESVVLVPGSTVVACYRRLCTVGLVCAAAAAVLRPRSCPGY